MLQGRGQAVALVPTQKKKEQENKRTRRVALSLSISHITRQLSLFASLDTRRVAVNSSLFGKACLTQSDLQLELLRTDRQTVIGKEGEQILHLSSGYSFTSESSHQTSGGAAVMSWSCAPPQTRDTWPVQTEKVTKISGGAPVAVLCCVLH